MRASGLAGFPGAQIERHLEWLTASLPPRTAWPLPRLPQPPKPFSAPGGLQSSPTPPRASDAGALGLPSKGLPPRQWGPGATGRKPLPCRAAAPGRHLRLAARGFAPRPSRRTGHLPLPRPRPPRASAWPRRVSTLRHGKRGEIQASESSPTPDDVPCSAPGPVVPADTAPGRQPRPWRLSARTKSALRGSPQAQAGP